MGSVFRIITLLAAVILCIPYALSTNEPKVDPRTGLIRILFIGDARMEAGHVTPFIHQDPLIALTRIPFSYRSFEQDAKTLRTLFPRHEGIIYEGFDVIITADVGVLYFPPKMQGWIKRGVLEHGLGLLMGGGPLSFGGSIAWGHPSWDGTALGDVLPVRCPRDQYDLGKRYHLTPATGYEDHPLVKGIPWVQVPLFCQTRVLPKLGSVVVGKSDKHPPGSPVLIYMDMGEGMSEAFVFDWGGNGPQDFHRWVYAPVVISNLIYYIARVAIPDDLSLFLRLRTQLTKYFSMRRYVTSILDFAEKFGANLRKAEKALTDSDEGRKEVLALYLEGDHEASLASLDGAMGDLDDVTQLALKAKDEALFWVYVIEWFTVSGTGMLCGAVIWSLMVKRAVYREVGRTRFDV